MFLSVERPNGKGMRELSEKNMICVDLNKYYSGSNIILDDIEGPRSLEKKRKNTQIIISHKGKSFKFDSMEQLVKQLEK